MAIEHELRDCSTRKSIRVESGDGDHAKLEIEERKELLVLDSSVQMVASAVNLTPGRLFAGNSQSQLCGTGKD